MKIRRTLAVAAATAVIGPVVLLSAPAAFADARSTTTETTSPAPTETASETPSPAATPEDTESATPSETPEATESSEGTTPETASPTPSATESETASATPTPTASETEDEDEDEPTPSCEPGPLDLSINGLAGKIVRGSGWDRFTFNIYNGSEKTVKNVAFFAGAAADKAGEQLFTSKQVRLQALNEADGTWEDLDELGTSSGYVGETDSIKPGYEVDISLRLKVEASAPVGAGFSLGGGLVFGEETEAVPCFTDVAYKFQIVKAGDEDGTKPQEGGSIPVPSEKPAGDTNQVTGSLAETGSSSSTPVFALAGGVAVVLGAGAMFLVRRRNNGDAAA